MSTRTVALELNDIGLTVHDADGPLVAPSPGYALFDGGAVITGRSAWERARLAPRRVEDRFWHELGTASVGRAFPRGTTHADLAYHHLRDLRRELPDGVAQTLVAISGAFSAAQLGLLLGIAAAAGWPVVGLVDSAVAAAAGVASPDDGELHLELELHRAVLSEVGPVARRGGIERRRLLVESGVGLAALERTWARFFAAGFVRATRFDPLHSAESEQRLHLAMAGWLERLRAAESAELELSTPGSVHEVEVTRRQLVGAVHDLYDLLARLVFTGAAAVSGDRPRLLVGGHACRLPGLVDHLAAASGLEPLELAQGAPGAGALAARDAISSPAEAAAFVIRLPGRSRGAA